MFQDLDIVKLRRDIVNVVDSLGSKVSISAGSHGTVVIVFSAELGFPANDPLDYEVEFTDEEGRTLALLQLSEVDLELSSTFEEHQAEATARDALS